MDIKNFYKTLSNGVKMPALGYGTYKSPEGKLCVEGVAAALQTGYRHIDTASFYMNEKSVGEGIRLSGVKRDEIFLVTKVWNDDQGYDNALRSFEESARRLDVDYIDMLLIHWPIAFRYRDEYPEKFLQTWKAFEKLYGQKAVRAIGVCNCLPHHLRTLLKTAEVKPAVNQIELHIGYTQKEAADYSVSEGIAVEAWSPVAKGKALALPEVRALADKYGRTPAQIAIRWCIDKGYVPLPKSVTPERIKENADVFGFSLSADDIAMLDAVSDIGRLGSYPDDCPF